MHYLLSMAANMKWNQPKRKKYVAIKDEMNWRSEEHIHIRHGEAQCEVCTAGFQSCITPVFSHCVPFPTFQNGNVYPVGSTLEICDVLFDFDFIGDYSKEIT